MMARATPKTILPCCRFLLRRATKWHPIPVLVALVVKLVASHVANFWVSLSSAFAGGVGTKKSAAACRWIPTGPRCSLRWRALPMPDTKCGVGVAKGSSLAMATSAWRVLLGLGLLAREE